MPVIQFDYMNHKGETKSRKVDIDAIEFFFVPIWGYQPGWFVSGMDLDKMARRSFALTRIILPEGNETHKHFSMLLR